MDIKGLNKAEVLAALYNNAKPQGMGFLQFTPEDIDANKAQQLLNTGMTYFDYVGGRVMKINLKHDEVSTWGYDRDNGEGAAENPIKHLRK